MSNVDSANAIAPNMSYPRRPLGDRPIIVTTYSDTSHLGIVELVAIGDADIEAADVVEVEGVRMGLVARARCGTRGKRWHLVTETVFTAGGRDYRMKPTVSCVRCQAKERKEEKQREAS